MEPVRGRIQYPVVAALFCVCVLAFWTRQQFVWMYGGHGPSYQAWSETHYFGGLSRFYINAAESWNRGERYTDLVYPPGYVAILAWLLRVTNHDLQAARRAQGVLDATGVVAVFILAGAAGLTWPFALAAATLYAVLPLWAAGSTFLLAESVGVPLILWALVLLVWAARSGALVAASIAGLWLGGISLVRPDFILLSIVAAAFLWVVRRRARALTVLVLLASFALPVALWGLHNRRVHGAWTFASTSTGATLWEGLGEIPNEYGYVLDDSTATHFLAAHGLKWASAEGSAYLTREYWKAWRAHPIFVLRVLATRVTRILFSSDHLQPLFFARVRQLLDAAGFVAVLVAVWIRRNDAVAVFVLIVLPLYALGSIGIAHYEPRYVRYVPIGYVIAVGVLAESAFASMRRRGREMLLLGLVVAIVAVAYGARELRAIHRAASAGVVNP